jgi:predicted exporter
MDILSQLPAGSPVFRDYRSFLQSFGAFDSLILLVSGPPERIIPFTDELAPRLARIPGVGLVRYRVDLEAMRDRFLEPFRYQLLSEEDFDELRRRLEPTAIVERVRGLRRALAMPMSLGARRWIVRDPLGVDELVGRSLQRGYADPLLRPSSEYFLSRSGDAALMVVRPTQSAFETVFAERLLDGVRAAERELLDGAFRDVTVGHTGSYAYALADKRVLRSDMSVYFVFAPLAVLAIFHLGLRTLRILPFVVFPLLGTTTITFALSLFAFGGLNMISVAFAGIFYGLGIDSAIYFYALLREKAAAHTVLDRAAVRAAVCETLQEIGGANIVASLTTAVAFLRDRPLRLHRGEPARADDGGGHAVERRFHVRGAAGDGLRMGGSGDPSAASPVAIVEWLARAARTLARHRADVLGSATVLVVVCGVGACRARLDTDFTHLRPASAEAETVEREIRDRFGRVDAQGLVMVDGRSVEEGLRVTERVSAMLATYRREGIVQSYSTLSAFLPSQETVARRPRPLRFVAPGSSRGSATARARRRRVRTARFQRFPRGPRPQGSARADARCPERRPAGSDARSAFAAGRRRRAHRDPARPGPGVALATIRDRLAVDLPGAPMTVTGASSSKPSSRACFAASSSGFWPPVWRSTSRSSSRPSET